MKGKVAYRGDDEENFVKKLELILFKQELVINFIGILFRLRPDKQ